MEISILITSIGSLVSQNILDALEYDKYYRRDQVRIIGTNTLTATPNAFRCDAFYKVDRTGSELYFHQMEEILLEEAPDVVLTGRDEDAYVLYDLIHDHPEIHAVLPYGSKKALGICLNKLSTWEFCIKHNLAFADTFVLGHTDDATGLDEFIKKVGYPIIGKPIEGYASKGVFYLRTREEVHMVAKYDGYMLQEYLGNPDELKEYFELLDGPIPLFAHAPNVYHYSCHTIIGPDGSISPFFISKNQHDSGRTVGFRKVDRPEIESLAITYAKAIIAEGGAGSMTIQFRPAQGGGWKAQEVNMRCNGNTFPRLILGQDEIGVILNAFLPDKALALMPADLAGDTKDLISKTLYCNRISRDLIDRIEATGYWERSCD